MGLGASLVIFIARTRFARHFRTAPGHRAKTNSLWSGTGSGGSAPGNDRLIRRTTLLMPLDPHDKASLHLNTLWNCRYKPFPIFSYILFQKQVATLFTVF